jgi:hypothetical protein
MNGVVMQDFLKRVGAVEKSKNDILCIWALNLDWVIHDGFLRPIIIALGVIPFPPMRRNVVSGVPPW